MTPEDLHQRILAAFQVEHKDHLEYIRAFLLRAGAAAPEEVDEAFRRAHSLKGAARAADLPQVEQLAHGLETLLARARRGELAIGPPVGQVISQVLDAIEDSVANHLQRRVPSDPAALLVLMEQCARESPVAAAPPLQPERAEPEAAPEEMVRLQASHLDHLLQTADLFGTEILRQRQVEQSLKSLEDQVTRAGKQWLQQRKASRAALQQLEAQPDFTPVARLMEETQQVFQDLIRQVHALNRLQRKSLWTLGQGLAQLQEAVLQARVVPAENIFQGFRKMVRDLARDQGKSAALRIRGLDLEADRVVLQALKDPVMHLLRNAVTHGIETPPERLRQGKEATGAIAMQLEMVGNRLLLTIEDDGRGCDFGQIRQAAALQGLAVPSAGPQELAQLLFLPGFSTARQVTDLAGRGMGLSIVRQGVQRLQGEVSLQERTGGGTRFTLSIPLTAAAHRFVLVQAGQQEFAVPSAGLAGLVRLPCSALQGLEGKTVLLHRDEFLPVQSLSQVLSQASLPLSPGSVLNALILRQGARQAALLVEAFLSEREALLKEIEGPLRHNPLLLGAILREDGAPILVLQPAQLLEASQAAQALVVSEEPLEPQEPLSPPVPRILVVDDSMTTRVLEKSILEAHGYSVQLAVDGLEALHRLRSDSFSLVITDIQMPRLDGFGLLREIKQDPRFCHLPVILVTSLEDSADQERGLALGADAYIVKRHFDQRELVETIEQIL